MPAIGETLESTAARVPTQTAIVEGDVRIDYGEFNTIVNRVAHELLDRGVGKGDRVAFMGKNCAGYLFTFYAAAKVGAIFVPINPRSAVAELVHILGDCTPTVAVGDRESLDGLSRAADELSSPPLVLGVDDAHGYENLIEASRDKSGDEPGIDVAESDDAVILYTSGTTGYAKGVLMDHHRIIWTALSVPIMMGGMREGASLLHVAPLYHAGQLAMMLIPGTMLGAKHVILSEFVPTVVLETMAAERTTAFFGPPTMYKFLLDAYLASPRDLSAWDMGLYGAAPMPKTLAETLQREFADVRIYSCFGQTEAGPNGIFSRPEEVRARPDVTGYRGMPGMNVRVADEHGRDVAPGEIGEVLLRGVSVMKGYWNNPEATSAAFTDDGWLRTGDLARLDDDGGITIVDRLKDMIISGGRNIYSAEVENAIASFGPAADCAVLGRPHPEFGETVVAVITPKDGEEVTLEALRAHCSDLISDYKIPREVIIAPIPRNLSGKIMKHVLRAEHSLS